MKVAGCPKCCEILSSHNENLFDLWMRMAATSLRGDNGIVLVREQNIPEFVSQIRLLEKLGFTRSADGGDAVRFKVIGHQKVFDEDHGEIETFCIDREGHGYGQK